ncbi:MAG: TetR/AcrR family transcriptional regulator [Thermodesulfobacteriota bacterium]|nr:TetR/AcrR family transcriptional regulator [Thermodesulfobacteriota bacterium]
MEKKKISRKEREFLKHRQEILDCALESFYTKGFHNVTMQEIARESEFAVGTIYKFFFNKEDLYRALILEKSKEFHSGLSEALEFNEDELESIRAYIETYIRLFMDNLKSVHLYLAETRGASFNVRAGFDEELRERHNEIIIKLSDVFTRGIEKKLFKDVDPYLLATALEGMTHSLLIQYLEYPDKHPFDPDLIVELFFNSIIRDSRPGR